MRNMNLVNRSVFGKGSVLAVAATFIVSGSFAPNALAVVSAVDLISPNGGEVWNGLHDITWIATGDPGDTINILLSDNDFIDSATLVAGLPFDAGSFAWDTAAVANGTNYKIRVQVPGGAFDTSALPFAVDNTPPTIASSTTYDVDGDGNVDKATVVFSEPVRDSSFAAGDFSIDGQVGASIVSGSADDNTFDVTFSGVTGSGEKTLVYTPGSGHDVADPGNLLAGASVLAADAAAPVFLSAETKTITTIELVFSEDLNGSTVNPTGTDFTLSAGTVSEAVEGPDDGTVVLAVSVMGTADTSTVNYVGSVKDLAGNTAPLASQVATDGVAPILTETTSVATPTNNTTPAYTFNATEAGPIAYGGGCTSAVTTAVVGSNPITFDVLAEGTYSACTITVTDAVGNASLPLAVSTFIIDLTPPVIDAHLDETHEATSASGAAVSYIPPTATDAVDGPLPAVCAPAPGSTFGLDVSTVTCNKTDAAGNAATPTTFTITVQDTTAPVIESHADIVVEATSPVGAVVTYTSPNSTDAVDGALPAECAPVSGMTFALGATTVTCTKTDSHGNVATPTTFLVTVEDTTPPAIAPHDGVIIEATSAAGAIVTFSDPTAADLVDGTTSVSCLPASGSLFALGNTTVTCTSSDALGNTATSTFAVHVVDTTPPTITAPSDITEPANGVDSTVALGTPTVSDAVDPSPVVTNDAPSTFPVGTTIVTWTATDAAGNSATAEQSVTIVPAPIVKLEVSALSPVALGDASVITVTGRDEFDHVTTNQSGSVIVISADNGGALDSTIVTLINGEAEATLTKDSAGVVNVTVSSGILAPDTIAVTFVDVSADVTPPSVVSHTPADGTTGISVNTAPQVIFSEPLNAMTVNSTNIQLRKLSDDSPVSALVSLVEGGTTAIITPSSPLGFDIQYYLAVSSGVRDLAGNALVGILDTTTKNDHEFTTVAVVPIVVDEIIEKNSTAAATDSYLAGWRYTFRITVNTAETDLSVKFTDWINNASSTQIVAANGNMRLLFNTATGNGLGSVVGLTDADVVSGVGPIASFAIGNEYIDQTPGAIDISALDISTDPGRQIKFDVFTKLPSSTTPGFYQTTFGIKVE